MGNVSHAGRARPRARWRRRFLAAALTLGTVAPGLGLAPPLAAAAGDVTFDGESGTLAGVSASAGATVSSAAARHGSRGLALSATAAPAFARWGPDAVPQDRTHASARLWVRVLSRGAGESLDVFTVQNGRRIENFDMFVNPTTGRLQWDLYRDDTDWSDFVVELGRWYLVEAQVEFAGAQYSATVRIDGVAQGTITTTQASTTVRAMWVGADLAKTHSQHYDDLALRVGDAPLGWLATTPPAVALDSPAEGATYGRGAAVAAAFACSREDFVVASCTGTAADGSAVDTSTLGPHQFTVTATDVAGYASSVTHHYTVVDQTAPSVELRTPADGSAHARGTAVTADYTCADEGGGAGLAVDGCEGTVADGAVIDTAVLGPHQFTVTATDASGNTTSVTHDYTVVDGTSPVVDLRSPADGAVYARGEHVAADYDCADEVGGTGLAAAGGCVGPAAIGAAVDTSTPGERSFTVTAGDAAGNVGSATHTYTVLENRPDNLIREQSARRFTGDGVYNRSGAAQTRSAWARGGRAAVFVVRVQNDTGAVDRFRVHGGRSDRRWTVTYVDGGRDVTRAVTRGTHVVGPLAPGRAHGLQVVIRPTARAARGARHTVGISSSAMAPGAARDRVAALVRRP